MGSLEDIPLELHALSFSEYCNPGCFTELAGEFDMLPGLVADINLKDCVSQEPLDMKLTVNQQRYMAALEDQDPYLVMGAPPCDDESLLHFGMDAYKDRHSKGRWFLHRGPLGG